MVPARSQIEVAKGVPLPAVHLLVDGDRNGPAPLVRRVGDSRWIEDEANGGAGSLERTCLYRISLLNNEAGSLFKIGLQSDAGANLEVLLADALHAKHLLIEGANSPIFITTMARYHGRAMVPDGHALSP